MSSVPMIPSIGRREKNLQVFTIEECVKCSLKTKRPFKESDYVFKEVGECNSCHSVVRIVMIFAEAIKPT